ncbi:pseudouridine synthase [uncultured Hymenobacter sp.]|uniref:pseudouridine synthase n=1 Tax=uncultured Hymenobacter sp. TaxID=170016 RepID=UPI0035CC1BBC
MGKKHFSDDKPGRRGPASAGGRSGGFRPGGDERRPGAGAPGSYGNRSSASGGGRPERGNAAGAGGGRPERGGYSPARPAFGRPPGGGGRDAGFGARPTGGPGREEGGFGGPRSYGNSAGRRFDRDEQRGPANRNSGASGGPGRYGRPTGERPNQRGERRSYGGDERGSRDNRPDSRRDEPLARPVRPYEPRQNWSGQPYRTEGQGAVPRGAPGERNRKFQKQNPFEADQPAERPAPREESFRRPEAADDRRETGADRPIRAARPFTATPAFPKEEGGRESGRSGGFERRSTPPPREGGFGSRSGGEQRRDTGSAFGRDAGAGRDGGGRGSERPAPTPGAFGRKPGARPGFGPERSGRDEQRPVGSSGPGYFKQLRQQLDASVKAEGRFGRADKPKRGEVAGEAPDYKNLKHYEDDKTRGNKRRRNDDDFGTEELRLNRYIANAGICSRREADALIAAGEIRVNGEVVTEMGYKVQPTDTVQYGKTNLNREKLVYVLLNKPKDFITTTEDPEGRKTVMELVANASKERIFPVGRLDRNTTGLLLFTNDGEVAQKLSHPSHKNKKIYQVELSQPLTAEHLRQIAEGLELEDGKAVVDDVAVVAGNPHFVGIEIHIGRNRIVRRIFEHLGYEIVALDRVQYAGLTKKELPRGKWRFLSEQEVIRLKYFL